MWEQCGLVGRPTSPHCSHTWGSVCRTLEARCSEVQGGHLFLLTEGFFTLLAQDLTNLMASLPHFPCSAVVSCKLIASWRKGDVVSGSVLFFWGLCVYQEGGLG